jgi:integrase
MSPHFIEPVWMDGLRQNKRTLKKIKNFVEPEQVYTTIIEAPIWKYRINKEFYEKRDRAFLALLYLLGSRACEIVRIKKSQFNFDDPNFIVIKDFEIHKRKKKTIQRKGVPKIDFPLPKSGSLGQFTSLVLEYYKDCKDERLFSFNTRRAWQIVNHMTGLWCHYFRSQRISYMINQIRSSDATAKIMGIENPQTISHYYKGTWREYEDELKK